MYVGSIPKGVIKACVGMQWMTNQIETQKEWENFCTTTFACILELIFDLYIKSFILSKYF